ncbi:hypothetical protein KUCAC02_003714, partial [Chaenocephalus aceratus]
LIGAYPGVLQLSAAHEGIIQVSAVQSFPCSPLSKLCVCEKDGKERHEEKVYLAVYVDVTSHSSVCPGFDTVL